MEELRAKADIREAETQKLETANAELRRSLLLRAEQKAELAQQSERSLRELEARWVVEGLQASRGPSDCETTGETPTRHQGRGSSQLLLSRPSHNPFSHTYINPQTTCEYTLPWHVTKSCSQGGSMLLWGSLGLKRSARIFLPISFVGASRMKLSNFAFWPGASARAAWSSWRRRSPGSGRSWPHLGRH